MNCCWKHESRNRKLLMSDQNNQNIYNTHNIKVMDSFIDKFARKYIKQRSRTNSEISSLSSSQIFKTSGFDISLLEGSLLKIPLLMI